MKAVKISRYFTSIFYFLRNMLITGQSGSLVLVNNTNRKFIRISQSSCRMKDWNFPKAIEAGTSKVINVKWQGGLPRALKKDFGNVEYMIADTRKSAIRIQALAFTSGYSISVVFRNLSTRNISKGSTISLGWRHNGFMNFVLTGREGDYTSTNMDGSRWMQDNLSLLGDKMLRDISIPGSHDAGMSEFAAHTSFAHRSNTLTQTHSIAGQLNLGVRYFDLRPVITAGKFSTGHYYRVNICGIPTWQGANGQTIESIVSDVNNFTAHNKELVILYVSHSLNTDAGNKSYRPLDQEEWNRLLRKLSKLENLFVASKDVDITTVKVSEFIESKASVVVIISENVDLGERYGQGFFMRDNFLHIDSYSNSNDVGFMTKDQLHKMTLNAGKYHFLLSWTLTQNSRQAVLCIPSIKQLADRANQRLIHALHSSLSK